MSNTPYLTAGGTQLVVPINEAVVLSLDAKEDKNKKGQPNGYAPLDANSKVPVANLPDSAALDAEVATQISAHNLSTTNVHGITNTANLVLTDDARLSDARTPTAATAWNASHTDANGIDYKPGTLVYYIGRIYRCLAENDAIQPQQGGNAYWQDLGLGNLLDESHSGTTNVHGITNTANLVLTDDARLTNARTPTAHTHAVADVTGLQNALDGKQSSGNYAPATGISPEAISGTAVVTNDARLSDARTPTAHTHAISDVTNLQTELNNKQASGTYATLVGGKVPSDQLPSYVDDVLEFANNEAFPATGEIGIIYVSLATNKTFRWSGSAYVEISPSEVTSVNTKTGAVTLTASDVGAAPSTGISPSAITGTAVVTTDSRLSDARTPTAHTHAISDVTNLQTTLDDKASSSHTHSVNGGTAVGSGALLSNTIGVNNSAVGASALQSNTTGGQNTAVGQGALFSNIEGQNNTAVGFLALQNSNAGHLFGGNTAVGVVALKATTTGIGNTAVGHQALTANTTGSNNTAVGVSALLNNAAENNSAFGYQALAANTSGAANTAVGYRALAVNTTSGNNTAIGLNALQLCTGGNNTAVGRGSLGSTNSGNSNVGIGSSAGGVLTTGSENVIIGSGANVDAVNRSRCVVLGYSATSPATNGSLAIGASVASGNSMGNLVANSAGIATGTFLNIYLNGTQYKIALLNPS